MEKVTVRKDELLNALKTNRDAHQGIFEEAVAGYKTEAEALLVAHLAEVRAGKMKTVYVHLDTPVNHVREYDRVIRMVEMSIDDQIELTVEEFTSYVMDDWRWKRQFLTTNSTYSGTARSALN